MIVVGVAVLYITPWSVIVLPSAPADLNKVIVLPQRLTTDDVIADCPL